MSRLQYFNPSPELIWQTYLKVLMRPPKAKPVATRPPKRKRPGPFSDKIPRVLKLLQETENNFTEIAEEVGLSRERIRQIARDYLGITGANRKPVSYEIPGIQTFRRWLNESGYRICWECKLVKCADEVYKRNICRKCNTKRANAYRSKNLEKFNLKAKHYQRQERARKHPCPLYKAILLRWVRESGYRWCPSCKQAYCLEFFRRSERYCRACLKIKTASGSGQTKSKCSPVF